MEKLTVCIEQDESPAWPRVTVDGQVLNYQRFALRSDYPDGLPMLTVSIPVRFLNVKDLPAGVEIICTDDDGHPMTREALIQALEDRMKSGG